MPDVNPQDIEKSLKNIQNVAIILTGATEFVCESRMLKRFSVNLEENLQKLETDIGFLKEKFPGKFPETLDPNSSLEKIRDIAAILKKVDTNVETKCRSGDLGDELSRGATELKSSIQAILNTISGKFGEYTLTDKITGFAGKTKSILINFSPVVSNTGRLILAIILVIGFTFLYLTLTMESEDDYLEIIKKNQAYLEEQSSLLDTHKKEYDEILEKIKSLENDEELLRESKIELLNLSVQEKKLKDYMDKAMIAMEQKEKNIEEQNKKLEKLREKSFFQKLLKR